MRPFGEREALANSHRRKACSCLSFPSVSSASAASHVLIIIFDTNRIYLLTSAWGYARQFASLLIEGRLLETILKAERGVASRGCGSLPLSREVRYPARQALRPGREELAARIRRQCRRWKRGTWPKIATVERRKARVPPALRDAGTPLGARHAALWRANRCRCTSAPVGAPPTPRWGWDVANPGRQCAAGTRSAVRVPAFGERRSVGLFDIVR
jgi:hypothetical protein